MISIMGLLSIIMGFRAAVEPRNVAEYPGWTAATVIFFTIVYMFLDAIDGIHARRTGNSSPLGELIDHVSDSVTVVFMTLSGAYLYGVTEPSALWYLVNTAGLVFMQCHAVAYRKRVVQMGRYTGPGEAIVLYCLMMALAPMFHGTLGFLNYAKYAYYGMLVVLLREAWILHLFGYASTAKGLTISLLTVCAGHCVSGSVSLLSVIASGLVMSVLTCDLILSKMASRQLGQWVPYVACVYFINDILGLAAAVLYLIGTVVEVARYLDLNIFQCNTVVYACGVFDMLHTGHIQMFLSAKRYGNKLLVGVHNDNDVASYKCTPIKSHLERCTDASWCRFVDEVIPNAPLCLTEEFIKEHNIHVVVCSDEYFQKEGDQYYRVPRDMGILREVKYSPGMSSSEIVRRCKQRA